MPVDPGILPDGSPLFSSEVSFDREFGSWLLVPRQRGHARERGGGTHAAHMPQDAATETRDATIRHLDVPPAVHGTHGGFRGWGRGGHVSARDLRAESSGANVTSPRDCFPSDMLGIGNPNIGPINTVSPRDGSQPNGSSSLKIDGTQSNGSLWSETDVSHPKGSLRSRSSRSSENNPNPITVLQTLSNSSKAHNSPLQCSKSPPLYFA